jgi:hypothetical protein
MDERLMHERLTDERLERAADDERAAMLRVAQRIIDASRAAYLRVEPPPGAMPLGVRARQPAATLSPSMR